MEPMDTESSGAEPGMLELNLRILGDVDAEQKQYLADEQELELRCSHPCVFPVIKSIQAIIMFTDDLKRNIAINKMEEIHKKYPSNINAMKNLIEMYKRADRKKETRDVEKTLESTRNAGGRGYELGVARSKLEKAYILLMDLHAETRRTPATLVEEARRLLQEDMKHSTSHRRDLQMSALESANMALSCLHEMQKSLLGARSNCTVETKEGRDLAERFFKEGLKALENLAVNEEILQTEILIWKHYYGKACNRIGSTPKLVLPTGEKKAYYTKAIELFHEVIKKISLFNTTEGSAERMGVVVCKERSFAYLAHLIITKDRVIAGKKTAPPECIAETYWKDPWSAFCDGIDLSKSHKKDPDRVILNRLALTLTVAEKEAHKRGPGRHRLELLVKTMTDVSANSRKVVQQTNTDQTPWSQFRLAETLCQLSLKKWPNPNWFAHFVLMKVYLTWYRNQFDSFKKQGDTGASNRPDKSLLQRAIASGEQVLKSRKTTDTLLDIATCYYYRAINPEVGKEYKKGRIEAGCDKFIYRALDFLKAANDHHDCENHAKKYALLGQCLFDIGDYEKAIDYMKKASVMEQSNRDPVNFETTSKLICEAYVQESRKNKKYDLLQELWIIIEENMRRYDKRLKYQLIGVTNSYPHPVIDMMNVIKDETEKYCQRTKTIFDICLSTLCRHKGERVRGRAERLKTSLPELDVLVFSPSIIRPSDHEFRSVRQSGLSFHGMDYDCYIIYSEADLGWIQTMFLPLLEQSDGEVFKCFVKGRDRKRNWRFSAEEVLRTCYKILVVIDDHFQKDGQCKHEMQTLLTYVLDPSKAHPKLKDGLRMIPVRRNPDYYPEELSIYHPLDFTKPPYDKTLEKLCLVLRDIDVPEENPKENVPFHDDEADEAT